MCAYFLGYPYEGFQQYDTDAHSFAPNAALKSAQFDLGLGWSPELGLSGSLVQSPPVSMADTPERSSAVAMSVRQDNMPPAMMQMYIQHTCTPQRCMKVYMCNTGWQEVIRQVIVNDLVRGRHDHMLR